MTEIEDALAQIAEEEHHNYERIVKGEPSYAEERAFCFAALGFESNAANPKEMVLPLRPLAKNEHDWPVFKYGAASAVFLFGGLVTATGCYFMGSSMAEDLRDGVSAAALLLKPELPLAVVCATTCLAAIGMAGRSLKKTYNAAMTNTLAVCLPECFTKNERDHEPTQLSMVTALQHLRADKIRFTPMN